MKDNKDCPGGEKCSSTRHLCKIEKAGDFELAKALSSDPSYKCKKCGRKANEAINLCMPSSI